MSENNDLKTDVPTVPLAPPVASPVAPPLPKIQETDRLGLELAKANRKTALAQAKQAMAENEAAELSYRYFVLQLYMKYGLTENDGINDLGEILFNHSATLKAQGQQ